MNTIKDILIIGQGIAGSCVAFRALQAGLTIDIYDQGALTSASSVSSGIINPITGRKYIKSWKIQELLPEAELLYGQMGQKIDHQIMHFTSIWRHLPDIEAENMWDTRMVDPSYSGFLDRPPHSERLNQVFSDNYRFGRVKRGMRIDVSLLIASLNQQWKKEGYLKEEIFDESLMTLSSGLFHYKEQSYRHVVLCTGYHGAMRSTLFDTEDYRPVKGEVLIVEIPNLDVHDIIKVGMFIVPIGQDRYWIGSNYEHNFKHQHPDVTKTAPMYDLLNTRLGSYPYRVVDHVAGIRPSTKYRRPFVGQHQQFDNLFILNGLGTKGVSLAPYYSKVIVNGILDSNFNDETKAFIDTFKSKKKSS